MDALCPAYRASRRRNTGLLSWHIRCIDGSQRKNWNASIMSNSIDRLFDLHQTALGARAYRSQVLASNIANADTPGYQAREVDFKSTLAQAQTTFAQAQTTLAQARGGTQAAGPAAGSAMLRTSTRHMGAGGTQGAAADQAPLIYRTVSQASIDNNTVDVNVERAQFADNALRYEASLTFINSKIKGLLAALQS
jgi:flagellar basal-body rod protein FlgB